MHGPSRLREPTVNGLDAIAALGDRAGGRVVWDMDWLRFDASSGRVRKLSVTDTGTGMTPEQPRQYINQLASSRREQTAAANFGVGAKIAAGSRLPHGLEYRSWHRGQGTLVRFKRHPDSRWGLEPQRWPDGRSEFWRPLGEQEKQGAPGLAVAECFPFGSQNSGAAAWSSAEGPSGAGATSAQVWLAQTGTRSPAGR